jgi:hypothetical protein
MNLARLGYWLLPPVVFRLASRMRNRVRRQRRLSVSYVRTDLNALRKTLRLFLR